MAHLQILIIICLVFVKYDQAYNVNSGWRRCNSRILPLPQSNTLNTNSFFAQQQPSLSVPFPNLRSENSTESLIQIIRLGEQWLSRSPLYDVNINQLSDEYVTVFGCLANVKLKAWIDQESRKVIVTGIADSKVALGMLAYIAETCHLLQGIKTFSANEVLRLNAEKLAEEAGIERFLPVGRLNGFINILRTIQQSLSSTDHGTTSDPIISLDGTTAREDEIAVLLSGGVDSSVALALLKQQGLKVRAYYLKIWLEDELAHLNECPWEEDLIYARAVCDQLKVPLEVISLQKEYWNYVVNYTLHEAKEGRTPNPDIMCNSFIKFGAFYEYIGKFHKKIASGHYARLLPSPWASGNLSSYISTAVSSELILRLTEMGIINEAKASVNTNNYLGKSPDAVKDQSYFLSNLKPFQISKCLFPIGDYQKEEIRRLARSFDLPTQSRKDSQGICFLGKLKFEEFLKHYLGESVGEIVYYHLNHSQTPDLHNGQVIGRHNGLWFHTIGQRKGIGNLLSPNVLHHGPFYVVKKNMHTNTLFVTNHWDIIEKPRTICYLQQINWLLGKPNSLSLEQLSQLMKDEEFLGLFEGVKLRHGPSIIPARISWVYDAHTNIEGLIEVSAVRVELLKKDKGIAPGQFAVLYIDDYCLASGSIQYTVDDDSNFT